MTVQVVYKHRGKCWVGICANETGFLGDGTVGGCHLYFVPCSLKVYSLKNKKKIKCLYSVRIATQKIKKIMVKEILRAAQNGARHEEKKGEAVILSMFLKLVFLPCLCI